MIAASLISFACDHSAEEVLDAFLEFLLPFLFGIVFDVADVVVLRGSKKDPRALPSHDDSDTPRTLAPAPYRMFLCILTARFSP